MGLIGLGVIVLVIYLAIRALASASAWISGNRFRAYRALASRFRGRYESRGFSDPPTVSFEHGGTNVRVGLAPNVPGQALGPRTRVVGRFSKGIPFRLELTPSTRPAPPQPPKGTRLVRQGDPDFDRAFVVQANDPEMARAFLDPNSRRAILFLQRLAPPSGILLSVNPERILVQVDRNLALSTDALLQAVHHALILHDALILGVASRLSEGIEIVDGGETPDEVLGPPICKVCGEAIAGDAVRCSTCRTPHHRDCWEFVGACSIYGCGQKQYTGPTV